MTEDSDLATTLAAVAQALAVDSDPTMVMARICELAMSTVDGCDHADIMILSGKTLAIPAATDWLATRVVSIEAQFREGPCVEALQTGTVVEAPDLEREHRWAQFTPRCIAETPVRSCVGLPLLVNDRTLGALDLYSDQPDVFDAEQVAAATLFAAHAAVALEAANEREQLRVALASRDIIGQAKGILMAQSDRTSDEAFELLRRASQRLNQKLAVVAQRIVDERNAQTD